MSARNVVLREFDNDGFVIVTDSRSKKIDNIVSLHENFTVLHRSYRIKGVAILIEFYRFRTMFHTLPCVSFGIM